MARPSERYDGIILQSQKKGNYHVVRVFSKQAGLISLLARTSRQGKQGFGAFLPFSLLTFDAIRQGETYLLQEYDGKSNRAMRDLTLDTYVYSQIFVDMVQCLVPPAEPDADVYALLTMYSQVIASKPIRLVTILAGWQLVGLAGFAPDAAVVRIFQSRQDGEPVYYVSDDTVPVGMQEVGLTPSLRADWQRMLSYRWGQDETVHFSRTNVDILERLLYQYVEQCSERKLNSLTLWRQLQ